MWPIQFTYIVYDLQNHIGIDTLILPMYVCHDIRMVVSWSYIRLLHLGVNYSQEIQKTEI